MHYTCNTNNKKSRQIHTLQLQEYVALQNLNGDDVKLLMGTIKQISCRVLQILAIKIDTQNETGNIVDSRAILKTILSFVLVKYVKIVTAWWDL